METNRRKCNHGHVERIDQGHTCDADVAYEPPLLSQQVARQWLLTTGIVEA